MTTSYSKEKNYSYELYLLHTNTEVCTSQTSKNETSTAIKARGFNQTA